jgi:RNase P/RNase MRP subunit p29
MARIIGNLAPEDDLMHPLGPEQNFNESAYYNFFDTKRSLGGWFRIGNRANEGNAERTVCLYLPDGRVLFSFGRPAISNNDAFDAAGLRFEVVEMTDRHRTTFDGNVVELREPRQMADPRDAFKNNPKKRVTFDLEHIAVGPLYGHKAEEKPGEDASQGFARAHFEQHMRVTGSLTIDGEVHRIEGFGLRDHSWGPRFWQSIHSYEWLTMNFGEGLGAMVSIVQRDAEGKQTSRGGVIVRGMEMERIVDAQITAEYEDNGLYHKSLTAKVKTESGAEHTITGKVTGFIPLRNRRENQETFIGEGMTEWRMGDQVGYGLSEFLRQKH